MEVLEEQRLTLTFHRRIAFIFRTFILAITFFLLFSFYFDTLDDRWYGEKAVPGTGTAQIDLLSSGRFYFLAFTVFPFLSSLFFFSYFGWRLMRNEVTLRAVQS